MLKQMFRKSGLSVLVGASLLVFGVPSAHALTALKQIKVLDGSKVEMEFDGKLKESQIKLEYFNDVIQVSLNDVSVYPAKIFSVSGPDLAKVFAYQYSPKLVRTRLTVKGKAEAFKGRTDLEINGKFVTVKFGAATDAVAHTASQAARSDVKPAAEAKEAPKKELSADEKILLDKVLSQQPAPVKAAEKTAEKTAEKASENKKDGQSASWGAKGEKKPATSFLRVIGMLGLVLGSFLALVLLVKQARKMTGPGSKRFNGMLGRFVRVKLGHREKLIDVVATHYLGPKKSIAVVRVCGKLLVLGVSNEAINLIAQLPADGKGDDLEEGGPDLNLEEIIGASLLQEAQGKSATKTAAKPATKAAAQAYANFDGAMSAGPARPVAGDSFAQVLKEESARPSVKDRIKSRLEGMKQL